MRYLLVLSIFLVSVAPAEALLLCARIDSGTGELRDGSSIKLRRECRSGESSLGTTDALARLSSGVKPGEAGLPEASRAAATSSMASTDCGLKITSSAIFSTHCNVYVQNGLGSTETRNDTGNLIIGYDEPLPVGTTLRTGSHNLVLGKWNSYTSFGGIVAGENNKIRNEYSVAIGGVNHVADGEFSTIVGGTSNTVTSASVGGSVSGGYENTVSGADASVSGGSNNTAAGKYSTVIGGDVEELHQPKRHLPLPYRQDVRLGKPVRVRFSGHGLLADRATKVEEPGGR